MRLTGDHVARVHRTIPDPGPVLANYGVDNLRFLTPVYFGDSLQVRLTCKEINPREADVYAEVRWDCSVVNQNGEIAAATEEQAVRRVFEDDDIAILNYDGPGQQGIWGVGNRRAAA